jgi:hypothetical protein
MTKRTFEPGFRLSRSDGWVLVLGTASALATAQIEWWMGAAIAFVVGHFFLFCNVFRMARRFELVWAALFVALSGSSALFGLPGWYASFGLSWLATLALVAAQLRQPSYHGILWQRVNPKLRDWWAAQDRSNTCG